MPEAKVVDYLLNDRHPQGRAKAAFFRRLGFRAEEPEALRAELLRLAATTEMMETASIFGRKFAGGGEIMGPGGRAARIVSVWMLANQARAPVLVTAYPE